MGSRKRHNNRSRATKAVLEAQRELSRKKKQEQQLDSLTSSLYDDEELPSLSCTSSSSTSTRSTLTESSSSSNDESKGDDDDFVFTARAYGGYSNACQLRANQAGKKDEKVAREIYQQSFIDFDNVFTAAVPASVTTTTAMNASKQGDDLNDNVSTVATDFESVTCTTTTSLLAGACINKTFFVQFFLTELVDGEELQKLN